MGAARGAAILLSPWLCLIIIPFLAAGYMYAALKLGIPPARTISSGLSEKLFKKTS
jgi:hypothetical protein